MNSCKSSPRLQRSIPSPIIYVLTDNESSDSEPIPTSNIKVTINQQYCESYLQHLHSIEKACTLVPDYLSYQKNLSKDSRFFTVSSITKLGSQTLADAGSISFAIRIFDKLLSQSAFQLLSDDLLLYGSVCLLIAGKILTSSKFLIREIRQVFPELSENSILQTEILLLQSLNFDVLLTTPIKFILAYSNLYHIPQNLSLLAQYFSIFALFSNDAALHPNEILAINCLFLAEKVISFPPIHDLFSNFIIDNKCSDSIIEIFYDFNRDENIFFLFTDISSEIQIASKIFQKKN